MDVLFVLPDYLAGRPRACMGAGRGATSSSRPTAACCRARPRTQSPGSLGSASATRPLGDIWRDSPALVRFRGEAWMPEPCRSCDERGATSAAAAARRSRSPATPPRPIRRASARRRTRSSAPRTRPRAPPPRRPRTAGSSSCRNPVAGDPTASRANHAPSAGARPGNPPRRALRRRCQPRRAAAICRIVPTRKLRYDSARRIIA